ncbi:hypothetical protein F5B22DRAFT_660946 [Xylaria bambusicola]|uniref:uncharacterized protein n=1 Tax=Xylaria bambusicola TaxID=326684 RepID=UPI002007E8C4|nr:uncharacterized protein F5B22DRAFT_660946 [Xylaria bambusicola]KAI0505904.1 hypothetical protein F5B22DRAFT_660946 [Xylaria bambusicola]
MQFRFSTALLGLVSATAVSGQFQELQQEGPFALKVKGQASNSSINGYLKWYNLGGLTNPTFISYEPNAYPTVSDSSYQWYFNYTGFVQYREHEVGFLVVNPTANTTTPSPYRGQVMDMTYQSNSNVGVPLLGLGTNSYFDVGFDDDNKAFNTKEFDDGAYVPGVQPEYDDDLGYYHWAVCWQFSGMYQQTLSWITYGTPHNPTCELVDLVRVTL